MASSGVARRGALERQAFVENAKDGGVQIAYLPAKMAEELSGGAERLLFLGLWKETAVFAVDLEGGTDPADGPLSGLGRFEELRGLATRLPATDAAIMATAKQMFEWRRRHRHCSNCGQQSDVVDAGLEARLPRLQGASISPYRPGGHHAGRPRRSLHGRPPGRLAAQDVLGPGRLPGAGREHRGGLRPRAERGGRPEDRLGRLSLDPALALSVLA